MADDQLSPDELASQVYELNTDPESAPDTLSPHQMAGLQATDHIEDGEMKDHLDPEELNHEHATAIMNGTYGQGPVPEGDTLGKGNTWAAAQHFYKDHDSMFRKILYSLNLPEQFLMRQGVAFMSGLGAISDQTTKELLTNDELSPSDVLDYYWKPSSTLGKAARVTTGLLGDIILDPLNLIGVGEAKSAATIAGKTITGLEKMAPATRGILNAMSDGSRLEKVISTDGAILHAEDALKAESTLTENMKLLADARDSAVAGNPLGFVGLQQALQLSPEGRKAAEAAVMEGLTRKSAAAQLAAGDRELTIGLRVPFTNLAIEGKIPGPMSTALGKTMQAAGNPGLAGATIGGLVGGPMGAATGGVIGSVANSFGGQAFDAMNKMAETMGTLSHMPADQLAEQSAKMRALAALDNGFNLGGLYAGAMGMSQEIYRKWQGLWSTTSDLLANRGLSASMNLVGATENQLAQQVNKWNAGWDAIKKRAGDDAIPGLVTDLRNELEKGIYTPEEAAKMGEAKGLLPDDPLVLRLHTVKPDDMDRMQRLAAHPELTDMMATMRDNLKTMVERYKARGIPFEELNPFGEGWPTRYLKHTWAPQWRDYMSKSNAAQDAFVEAMRGSEDLMGTIDESALGRKYRSPISEMNDESFAKTGVKMFVDDPVQLYTMRVREMQEAIAKHDIIKSAMPGTIKGYNPGFGWMPMDPVHFGHMESLGVLSDQAKGESKLGLADLGPALYTDKTVYKAVSFLPEELRSSFANELAGTGPKTYIRSDVYDKILWNTQKQGSSSGLANTMAAVDAYTWFWKNAVLANTGFLGTKFFHNMLSYFGLMQNSNPEYIYKAVSAMVHPQSEFLGHLPGGLFDDAVKLGEATKGNVLPKSLVNWKQLDGTTVGLNHEQFTDLARQHGVLGTGTEVLLNDVLDGMAASAPRSGVFTAKNMINYGYMFAGYRAVAQWGDDLPKLATFAQRLEQGFTADAAAETAIKYFHNFHPVTAEQQLAQAVVPFISFPMKTAELMAGQVREGRLMELAMPGHVQKVLQGYWVEDRDMREYLTKTLPETKNWYEPLHGGITPGMRSMSIELPWCYNTLSAMWNEDTRLHPVFQLLAGAMAVKNDGNELDSITDPLTTKRVIGQNIDLALPQYARTALTLAAINGVKFPGADYLVERYQTKAPDIAQYLDLKSGKHIMDPMMHGTATPDNPTGGPSNIQLEQAALNTKFQNAADFGKWANTYLDSNWLYNLMFHGSITRGKESGGEFEDNQDAVRGEWIRQHIHDATLGLATFDKIDKTFFSKYLAVDRELKKTKQDMLAEANKTFQLSDPKTMMSTEALKAAEAQGLPAAKKILALMDEKNALVGFQDWFLMNKKKAPDFSLSRLLFGVDQLQMSMDGKPGPQMTEALHPRNANISDAEASRYFNQSFIKTLPGGK